MNDDVPDDVQLPSEDDLRSFLVLFRQFFLLRKEPVHVGRVYAAAIALAAGDDDLLDALIGLRATFQKGRSSSVRLTLGEKTYSDVSILRLWVSRYCHSDNEEAHRLLANLSPTQRYFRQFPLFIQIRVGVQELLAMKYLIRALLNRRDISGQLAK